MVKVKASDYFKRGIWDEESKEIGCIKCGETVNNMTYLFGGSIDLEIEVYNEDSVILVATKYESGKSRLYCPCGVIIPSGAFDEDWDKDEHLRVTIKLEKDRGVVV